MNDDDGQFDYNTLTKMQIEYAIQHIDGSRYPKNLLNARTALDARNSGDSPEPAPLLDAATDAKYTNRVEKILGILIALYAALGLLFDNVMIPYYRRFRGFGEIQLHGHAAWIAGLAMLLLASIPFLNRVDDAKTLVVKPRFRYALLVAVLLFIIAFLVSPKLDRLNLE
jgi:hypothetical protein